MKQRNGRMMVLTGTAIFSGLVIGTVAAAAGGVSSGTDIAVTRSLPPSGVAPGAAAVGDDTPSVVASALAAVAGRWVEDQVAATVGATADAGAVITAAAEGAPVTVAAPVAEAPTSTEPAVAAAAPIVEAAPAPEAPAPTPVATETAAVAAASAPTGSSVEAAIHAWFPDVYEAALRVADCESSLNPGAMSRGGGNHGLFQINNVHRSNFEAVTGQPWEMVYDAYYNSQYARRLYDASGWRPWTCRP